MPAHLGTPEQTILECWGRKKQNSFEWNTLMPGSVNWQFQQIWPSLYRDRQETQPFVEV